MAKSYSIMASAKTDKDHEKAIQQANIFRITKRQKSLKSTNLMIPRS
jgi:hypothetical protein